MSQMGEIWQSQIIVIELTKQFQRETKASENQFPQIGSRRLTDMRNSRKRILHKKVETRSSLSSRA